MTPRLVFGRFRHAVGSCLLGKFIPQAAAAIRPAVQKVAAGHQVDAAAEA
jgi:hypothetical protein